MTRLEDTLATKRTALLAKAAALARQQHETAGAIALCDELIAEAPAPHPVLDMVETFDGEYRAELEVEAVGMTPPAPHRLVPRAPYSLGGEYVVDQEEGT